MKTVIESQSATITIGGAPGSLLPCNVFVMERDDVARILDFERDRFYALDPIASEILRGVLDLGAEQTVALMAQNYGVTEDRIRLDMLDVVRNLEQKGVLATAEQSTRRDGVLARILRRSVRGATAALLAATMRLANARQSASHTCPPSSRTVRRLLVMSWLSLRLLGWRGTLDLLKKCHPKSFVPEHSVPADVLDTVDGMIRSEAARSFLLPMVCKERAVAGYHILRAFYRVPAEIVIGMTCYPFGAHAWVQCGGHVVTDDAEHCESFTPIARYT